MARYLSLIMLFVSVKGRLIDDKDEPRCYSRFDWEDKLLQKVIESDFKLNQHMAVLEETIQEMRNHKNVFQEWKQSAVAESIELRNRIEKKLGELGEWKTHWEQIIAPADITNTYTRWGRTSCPGNGSEIVYAGMAGGSLYSQIGSASSMLCLPADPDWEGGKYSDVTDKYVGYIYGAEYQDGEGRNDRLFGESHYDRDVPCVVCDVKKRSSVLMIPGRSKCYAGWTREYTGYLMAGYHSHYGTDYYCIDKDPENLPGGEANENGHLLYFVEAACGSLRCPPYVNGREFQCVVCSK